MAGSTYQSLQNQISQLQKKAQKLLAAESKNKNTKIARVVKLMKRLDVSVADLQKRETGSVGIKKAKSPKTASEGSRKPVAAKYRDVATGNTWSGRGKLPRWLVALEAEGRSREEFKIP